MIVSYKHGKRMIMRLLLIFLGSFYLQVVTCKTQSNSTDAKQTYRVVLSNSGPVIPGSKIDFHAHLEDEHGLLPSDMGKYKFRWSTTADDYKETIDANKNSTWKRCFNKYITPDDYHVEVIVYSGSVLPERIARASQQFSITGTLNGNINASQPLKHRHNRKGVPTFSTMKNITLKLNLTDSALHSGKLFHHCDWFVDNEPVGNATNSTEFQVEFAGEAGLHSVKAFVSYYGIPDCENNKMSPSNRSGLFNTHITLKDPIEVVNVRGNSDVKLHHALLLDVYYSGSPPFNACWSLQPVANQSEVLNQSCKVERMELEQNFTIFMNKTALVPGQYVINLTITNDVSLVAKRHFITVSREPIPYHSPADVLLPVMGGLIAITLFLVLTVYVINRKMAKKNVETANFDFHPPSLPLTTSGEHKTTFLEKLQDGLFRLFGSAPNGPPPRRRSRGRSVQSVQSLYGSCDNSLRSCA